MSTPQKIDLHARVRRAPVRCSRSRLTALRWVVFALVNASLALLWPLSKLYMKLISLPKIGAFAGCFIAHGLHIYCPGCGGTRAALALLRFDFAEAFRLNPTVPVSAALFIVLDIVAAVNIAKGRDRVLTARFRPLMAYVIFVAAVFVTRNVLLCFFGVDIVGDLGRYWS